MADVINTNQFKSGMAIEIDGESFTIVESQHVKPGKGGAFVRTKVRNISTGAVLDKTFRAGEKFNRVHTQSRKIQYLYSTDTEVVLMDSDTYEQVSVSPEMATEALKWVVENGVVDLMYLNGVPFSLEAPTTVELLITQTDPGFRGDTAHSIERKVVGRVALAVAQVAKQLGQRKVCDLALIEHEQGVAARLFATGSPDAHRPAPTGFTRARCGTEPARIRRRRRFRRRHGGLCQQHRRQARS